QIQFRFSSDSVQIQFRFSSDSVQIQFRFSSDSQFISVHSNQLSPLYFALMEHSGSKVRHLNIASCRHVSYEAFEQVFAEGKMYPNLKYLDISFSTVLDDYLTQCIFRCCAALQRLVVFACFKIRDVYIPKGVALIGTVGATIKVDGMSRPALCRARCRTRLDPKRHLEGGLSEVFGNLRRHINGLRDMGPMHMISHRLRTLHN
ncbi:hypothetical protein ACN38_g13184, partial [Penicillium nordicum]